MKNLDYKFLTTYFNEDSIKEGIKIYQSLKVLAIIPYSDDVYQIRIMTKEKLILNILYSSKNILDSRVEGKDIFNREVNKYLVAAYLILLNRK